MARQGLVDQATQPAGGIPIAEPIEVEQDTHDDLNANANLQVNDTDVSASNPVNSIDSWRVSLVSDETTNDSDKDIYDCPADTEAQVLWLWIELTTTATVGDRQLVVEIQDSAGDVIAQFRAGAVQAASLTRYYQFAASMADLTSFRDTDYLMTPLPPGLLLQAGDQLRVYDNNAVAAAADDLVCQMQIATRSV